MSAHTPGPWENVHRLGSAGQKLQGGRFVIRQVGSPKHEDTFICEAPWAAVRAADERECAANAALIAAAPDMLDALRLAESVYRKNCVADGEPSSVLTTLQAVIAKAEGRS